MRRPRMRRGPASIAPALLAGTLTVAFVLGAVAGSAGPRLSRAAAQPAGGEPTPRTDASLPAQGVTMIGATPQEAGSPGANETWGVGVPWGNSSGGALLVRFYESQGEGVWVRGPALLDAHGQQLSDFTLASSPLAGQMTPRGAGVLVGTLGHDEQVVLVRKPGEAFQQTAPVPNEGEGALLKESESLFGPTPLLAPLDEADGRAGALIVPASRGAGAVEDGVLHWNGSEWKREPIEIPAASSEDFRVLGIGASSPANAWLLVQLSSKAAYPKGAVALFRRVPVPGEGPGWSWKPVELLGAGGSEEAQPLELGLTNPEGSTPFTVPGIGEPPTVFAQLLTVTDEGVWVDGERADTNASATLYFKPRENAAEEGASPSSWLEGKVQGSWCVRGASSACERELPEALPSEGRSFAWPSSEEPFGERVITGLHEGVSLRLEGETFKRVLALGGGGSASQTPGARFGAAFSSPLEGWLGTGTLPVRLTLHPPLSKLVSWPLPFRNILTGIAPQPNAPAGALSSEALVVGDQGAVGRYKPGVGWLPETLFGPGGRAEKPRLRAVAWPTPTRAYAVGDEGQMWLWRGETGLWERDPATPLNFRGNLVGVAFDPNNPERGYAVGSSELGVGGVLLRYGKTWTEEQDLPAEVQGAFLVSIAFAGSEAIVAYRKQVDPERPNVFAGGLLVNDGSGWRIDQEAASLIGSGAPEAVAGLPDGGAAFAASSPEGTHVFERESAGAAWVATSTPVPRGTVGALALFREGGTLRAIATSGGAGNNPVELNKAPPPGFPPLLVEALPFGASNFESGLLRQGPDQWADESHELNGAGEAGEKYPFWDMPYSQEPVLGVLIEANGSGGWAIGGEQALETASIFRYQRNTAENPSPPGVGSSSVPLTGAPTFAIGGGAQCAEPCASRALANPGPDVWLATALQHAGHIGVRAFLYTGPRLTNAETETREPPAIPYERELERYASILASSPIPAYAAASPQDLNGRPLGAGAENTFLQAFGGFPQPFGRAPAAPGLAPAEGGVEEGERRRCEEGAAAGCEGAYYAINSEGSGGTVRVIVLDDTHDVDSTQLGWLERQLANAAAQQTPAIVIGNANLATQMQAGDARATAVVQTLERGNASAYFYYAPQENVQAPLQAEGGEAIPSFGTGTLGYVEKINEQRSDFHGASGFLLGEVDVAARQPDNRAPVHARLIPNIGELALEAKDGILLRRSQPALFSALARRPRAGNRASQDQTKAEIEPYIPIPSICVGKTCATALLPEYSFNSSREDIGDFVAQNTAVISAEPRAVLQGSNGKPIHDPQSGLFCAYNAGTTTVTISAGGLSASLPVTVQPGSVRQPCGTVPLKELPARSPGVSAPVPPPPPGPAPAGPSPAASPAPVPLPVPAAPPLPPAAHQRQAAPKRQSPPPFAILPPAIAAPLAFAPPPLPTPARPTPPSGTSAVTSPIEVAEHEEDEEEATESVANQAVAYRSPDHEPSPVYLVGLLIVAAFAGVSLRRPRRGRREVRVAPATLSTLRSQRRHSRERFPR